MPSEKLISVCINAYNSENTIEQTVRSVLNQTYTNLQVIVVDDCSGDRTAEIVDGIDDSRLELYLLPENGNISNCNNEAISHARGEYIAHLDSDDMWAPDKLEKQLAFLEANPEYGACFTHVRAIDENGNPLEKDSYFEHTFNIGNLSHAEFVRYFYDNANRLCHSSVLIRKSVQDEIGLHDLSLLYLHDCDMWMRLIIRYPIYILQEPLVNYRVRQNSNSRPTEEKMVAHNNEYARVAYNFIDNCPDGLFLEAFRDKLRYKGEHSHIDTELEKAFVLLDAFKLLEGNYSMGIRKFDSLFNDKQVIRTAKEHFGFTLRDFYDLHKNEIYYDKKLRDSINDDYWQIEELVRQNTELANEVDSDTLRIKALEENCNRLSAENAGMNQQLFSLMNSKSMKLTKPMRNVRTFMGIRDYLTSKKLPNGKMADAKVVLFGFFGHNLGDDLFFHMLFCRYPNTLFCVAHTPDYAAFCSRYPNVKFFDISSSQYQKFNAIGKKLGIDNWCEKLLYGTSDAAVHIGGSIYQQIADWQVDIAQRKKRNAQFKNFFAISNNFGPYSTRDYKDFWANEFNRYNDVCFRDIYSYSLFSGNPKVRYAPDLLFSYAEPSTLPTDKKVAISVFNPRFRVRSFTEEQCLAYENRIKDLMTYYVGRGYRVSLMSFCVLEEDRQEAEKLWLELDHSVRKNVNCVNFTDDYNIITNEIKSSEIVIATRFHAMILGYVLGKRVLPICYGDKITNVIDDLNLTRQAVSFEQLDKLSAEELAARVNSIPDKRIAELRRDAMAQFYALDRYISSLGGTVL